MLCLVLRSKLSSRDGSQCFVSVRLLPSDKQIWTTRVVLGTNPSINEMFSFVISPDELQEGYFCVAVRYDSLAIRIRRWFTNDKAQLGEIRHVPLGAVRAAMLSGMTTLTNWYDLSPASCDDNCNWSWIGDFLNWESDGILCALLQIRLFTILSWSLLFTCHLCNPTNRFICWCFHSLVCGNRKHVTIYFQYLFTIVLLLKFDLSKLYYPPEQLIGKLLRFCYPFCFSLTVPYLLLYNCNLNKAT